MNNKVKEFLKDFIEIAIIYILTFDLWILLEKMILGYIDPSPVDDIIYLILASSLYMNYSFIKSIRKNR